MASSLGSENDWKMSLEEHAEEVYNEETDSALAGYERSKFWRRVREEHPQYSSTLLSIVSEEGIESVDWENPEETVEEYRDVSSSSGYTPSKIAKGGNSL